MFQHNREDARSALPCNSSVPTVKLKRPTQVEMKQKSSKSSSVLMESSCHVVTLGAVMMEELGREVEKEEEEIRIVCREGREVSTGRSLLRLLSPSCAPCSWPLPLSCCLITRRSRCRR